MTPEQRLALERILELALERLHGLDQDNRGSTYYEDWVALGKVAEMLTEKHFL